MDTRRRLYHARINSHLTLEQIGLRTALSPTVLRYIDEGKFELLPSGLYARSYIRTFASAVGVNPEAALAEVEDLLPGAPDPLPALSHARPDPAEWAGQLLHRLVAAVAALVTTAAGWIRGPAGFILAGLKDARRRVMARTEPWSPSRVMMRRGEPLASSCRTRADNLANRVRALSANDLTARLVTRTAVLRARLEGPRWQHERLRRLVLPSIARLQASPRLTRCSAAVIDALLLLVVDSFLVLLVSWSSGIPVIALLTEASWAIGALCAIPIALYFVLFGGIAGSTLGGYLCNLITVHTDGHGSGAGRPDHPLTLPEILRRAVKQ